MSASITFDHDEIRLWAQAHRGRPEIVTDPGSSAADPILRLDFPGQRDDIFLGRNLGEKTITWREFFELFDKLELAFEYDRNVRGDASNAYRFIKRFQGK